MTKTETLRRLRYGALLRLLRARCGPQLPDDDAGREYLFELVCVASLASKAADKKLANAIDLWAPWMSKDEAETLVEHIQALTVTERTPTPEEPGRRLRLTNAEREACCFWLAMPVDMSAEDLKEFRKTVARNRKREKRRAKGIQSREDYLAKRKAAASEPWIAMGVSRATYFRRRKPMRLGVSTTIVNSEDQTKSQGHQVRASDRSQTNVVYTRTSYQRPEGRSLPISPRVPVLGTDQVSLCVPVMELGPGTDLRQPVRGARAVASGEHDAS